MTRPDAFFFGDGSATDTLEELRDKLRDAPHELTAYHITEERNDYAAWARYVHHEEELARRLEKCRSVEQAEHVLTEFLEGPEDAHEEPSEGPLPEEDAEESEAHDSQPEERPEPQPLYEEPEIPEETRTEDESVAIPQQQSPDVPRTIHEPPPHHALVAQHPIHALRDFLIGFVLGIAIGVIGFALLRAVIG